MSTVSYARKALIRARAELSKVREKIMEKNIFVCDYMIVD